VVEATVLFPRAMCANRPIQVPVMCGCRRDAARVSNPVRAPNCGGWFRARRMNR
jgi:hypothetical protein